MGPSQPKVAGAARLRYVRSDKIFRFRFSLPA